MRSLQQREDSEACSYISQPMGRPPLQRLLWRASLRRLRDGRLDGFGYRVRENGVILGMEVTTSKTHITRYEENYGVEVICMSNSTVEVMLALSSPSFEFVPTRKTVEKGSRRGLVSCYHQSAIDTTISCPTAFIGSPFYLKRVTLLP